MSAQPQLRGPAADRRPIARRLRLAGRVQGVGFRPFVHRLASELGLTGSVQNVGGEVDILVQGSLAAVERFARDLLERAPPLSQPHVTRSVEIETLPAPQPQGGFLILDSAAVHSAADGAAADAGTPDVGAVGARTRIYVPPDSFTCKECLAELADASGRRYRYPFINCTQCGPRYTLIESLPYDRPHTTMSGFALCPSCRREYSSPLDRRFHAEPVACAACGPTIWLEPSTERGLAAPAAAARSPSAGRHGEATEALAGAVDWLRRGGVVAVKGIGGYHLLCDARSARTVERLRARKRRPAKPFAVMFPPSGSDALDAIRREVILSDEEANLLLSPARPILLARKRPDSTLAPLIAPGLSELGVLLPYSPLHHLLLGDFGGPLVATSGNVSGEPVLIDVEEARTYLGRVADASLHHDRPIARPADDSVLRWTLGKPRALRLGRGLAPRELELPWPLPHPVLATGGHLKTTVALAWDERVVISPHIGDLGTARARRVFAQVAGDLQRLYGVRAAEVVCDAHPDYATSRWAEDSGLPLTRVLHHAAHASALAGEHDPSARMLVFTWDGVGLGDDGTLWGGEALLGMPGQWTRVASLRPFRLPGAERAGRSPWRSAAALCWELGRALPAMRIDPLAHDAWRRNLNCPRTTSVGRLFDAAAALVLGLRETSYEGEGPMMLEAAAASELEASGTAASESAVAGGGSGARSRISDAPPLPMHRDPDGLLRLDWEPLVDLLLEAGRSPASSAVAFHATLAATVAAVAEEVRRATGTGQVGLTGGVFQNALLTELAHASLSRKGFEVCLAEQVPCNDGGLSYGQIIELAGRSRPCAER